MKNHRKPSTAFRPSINDMRLEDRVVLNAASLSLNAAVAEQFPGFANRATANFQDALTRRQIQAAFRTQLRDSQNQLRTLLTNEFTTAFANGRPTAQQLADLNAFTQGAVNAVAFRLSSQAGLLPGSTRLVSAFQNSLLGNSPNSLLNRFQFLTQSNRFAGNNPLRLQFALNRQLNNAFANNNLRLNNFFRTTPLNFLSVDATTGQRIPLQQFMANQVINQLGNSFAALSRSFPTVANSTLFANGATTATPEALAAFQSQVNPALGTLAFQLGSDLSLFPFSSTGVAPQLQSALFGTGPNSFITSLQTLPNTSANFNTAAATAFNNGFNNLVNPLNGFFNLPVSPTGVTIPSGAITGIFNPPFDTFGNGFNNGFGNGFIGFGTTPTTFNTNFGTGFNGFVTNSNTLNGFTFPTTTGGVTGIGGVTGTGGVTFA